jgi:hypothetical protein
MTKPQVQEIDALTGEIIVRDYTVAELAEVEKAIEQEEVVKALKAEAVAKKAAAEAKLTALGLTTDDLKALGIN